MFYLTSYLFINIKILLQENAVGGRLEQVITRQVLTVLFIFERVPYATE